MDRSQSSPGASNPNSQHNSNSQPNSQNQTWSSFMLSPVSPQITEFPDPGQSAAWKEKYDRQLRLWGIHGQQRIDEANVVLLNASAVGCEVLKNLILPGFGEFMVVDAEKVKPEDLGVNFFVTKEELGQSRGKAVTTNLVELNPATKGSFLMEDPRYVIDSQIEFFDTFNYIITAQLESKYVQKLATYCEEKNKVLIVTRSVGFIGYLRVYSKCHEVVEAKPENERLDLRISDPFPEFKKYCDVQDLEKMDHSELHTTPFVVLLYKALQIYQKEHNNQLPSSSEEFEPYIKKLHKGGNPDLVLEQNFAEAFAKSYLAWSKPSITWNAELVLNDPLGEEKKLTAQTSSFWFLVCALKRFIAKEGNGALPINGKLPDMESDTQRYAKLQSIYRRKAREHAQKVKTHLQDILKTFNLKKEIPDSEIKDFCKNAQYLRVFHYRTIQEELNNYAAKKEDIMMQFYEPDTPLKWYFMLMAVDIFYDTRGRYPGKCAGNDFSKDAADLKKIAEMLCAKYAISDDFTDLEKYTEEITRYGGSELHNISSLIGGIAAQETIKLVTKQRVPLNNTFIFDGIHGKGLQIEL